MPISLEWIPDPSDAARVMLRGTNNTLTDITNIQVAVPEANRAFNYPGPMTVGGNHVFWQPLPGRGNQDVTKMNVTYYNALGIQIQEPFPPNPPLV